MAGEKFDGIADVYDRFRPNYPSVLIEAMCALCPQKDCLAVADIGAGTGIATAQLIEQLGDRHRISAIDISADMVRVGKAKLPVVAWHVGTAEAFLEDSGQFDLVLAAQAFQWMDRQAVLRLARERLAPGGMFAVLQNNRDFNASRFLGKYEDLLEDLSPGYDRNYRAFDFAGEIGAFFSGTGNLLGHISTSWEFAMPKQDFIGMSRSSTQAQRAIAAHGDVFIHLLKDLVDEHFKGETVAVAYESELFFALTSKS